MTLYRILEDLNHDILDTLAVGDMIEDEVLESMKQDVQSMQKVMDEMKMTKPDQNEKNEQAVF